jgi:hypothetical protein
MTVKCSVNIYKRGDSESEENSSDCDRVKYKSNLERRWSECAHFENKWLQEDKFKMQLAKCDDLGMAKCVLCLVFFPLEVKTLVPLESICSERNTNSQWQLVLTVKQLAVYLMVETLRQKHCCCNSTSFVYHSVVYCHSYLSTDRGIRLSSIVFKDPKLSKKLHCGCTKCEMLEQIFSLCIVLKSHWII